MSLPEEHGGGGKDRVSFVLSLMEVSKTAASFAALAAANHSLYCSPLRIYGNQDQKRRYLQPCASGKQIGSCALPEVDSGGQSLHIPTKAVRGRDGWTLQGVKRFVPNGADSSFCIVSAVGSEGDAKPGWSSFIMDLREGQGEGWAPRIGRTEQGFNILALSGADITFENTRVNEDSLLGNLGEGMDHRSTIQRESWLCIAALAVGIGRGCFERAVETTTSKQARKSHPGEQLTQWKFADMAVSLDAAELLTLKAAWLKDHEKPHEREVAMARVFASDAAMAAAADCIQIAGEGCKEPGLEDYLRKAKMCQVSMGGNEGLGVLVARSLAKGK